MMHTPFSVLTHGRRWWRHSGGDDSCIAANDRQTCGGDIHITASRRIGVTVVPGMVTETGPPGDKAASVQEAVEMAALSTANLRSE